MRISPHIAAQVVLILAIPTTCLMAITQAVNSPTRSAPHRRPSIIKHMPYAAPQHTEESLSKRGPREPLPNAAKKALKTWRHAGWIATGGVERRHYWLARPVDIMWHNHLVFFNRQRAFWWHHRHLYYLWWLGQGWEYLDESQAATRPARSLAGGGGGTVASDVIAPEIIAPGKDRPSDVALRVQALSVLNGLQLTKDQFASLQDSLAQMTDAGNVVDADVIDNILDTKPGCLGTLKQLYKDFVLSNDDLVIDDQAALFSLEDKYQVCVDPTVVISPEASQEATQIFQLLSGGQIASYLAARGQVVPDPTDILMEGLNQCRQLSARDFIDYSNCLAERFAVLTSGLDVSADQPVVHEVKGMLERARALNNSDFAAQRSDFEQEARHIEQRCDPLDLVNHGIEWDLANFVANPQAKAMIAIRARQLREQS
jgi:hypothetical protein